MFLIIHIFFIIAKQFLIIGGETNSDGNDLATEVIYVQSNSNVASLFGEIPSQRRYAVGDSLILLPLFVEEMIKMKKIRIHVSPTASQNGPKLIP